MSRWEPNARERLEQAAMELYGERGFDETTVAEIAARAGLTERTFFRHFADKREVLFSGAARLREILTTAVASAPEALRPLAVVAIALEATSVLFEERRDFARQRQALIASHAELQERELIKLSALAVATAEALRRRGITEPAASLASEVGMTVFKLAFERWVQDSKRRTLAHHVREALSALEAVVDRRAKAKTKPLSVQEKPASKPRKARRSSA